MSHSPKLSFNSSWNTYWRVTALLSVLGFWSPLVILAMRIRPHWGRKGMCWTYRLFLFCLNIRIQTNGTPASGAVLFVSNHVSYADIPVLGALLAGQFVAKKQVGEWPLIGWVAKSFGTLFVSRDPRKTKKELLMLQEAAARHNLILFPEGTSGEGSHVLPFKSSFFEIVHQSPAQGVVVQPISLVYANLYGFPITRFFRKFLGWRGDVDFFPHLDQALRLGPCTVSVVFHEPLPVSAFESRKSLADVARQHVSQGVERNIRRRLPHVSLL